MATTTGASAGTKELREAAEQQHRELTLEELENVLGGSPKHGAQGGTPFLKFRFETVFTT
jgi:hypothetical protein